MITIGYEKSAFGGDIVICRQFFNPQTQDYTCLEAHEIRNQPDTGKDGDFMVACWIPDGNDGGAGMDGDLHHVVKSMQEFTPDPGLIEMPIPEGAWC